MRPGIPSTEEDAIRANLLVYCSSFLNGLDRPSYAIYHGYMCMITQRMALLDSDGSVRAVKPERAEEKKE